MIGPDFQTPSRKTEAGRLCNKLNSRLECGLIQKQQLEMNIINSKDERSNLNDELQTFTVLDRVPL